MKRKERVVERPSKLGKKLQTIRKSLGLSQSQILDELGFAEKLFRSNVSQYELGRREPPLKVLLAYGRIAKVSTDVLIDDELEL